MEDNRLPSLFYQSFDTLSLAQALLGCELIHNSPDGLTSGIIVETEAYLEDDPACHAYNRVTPRTQPMYGEPGTIYVYHIYGMYQCLNVVSNQPGIGEAVLIRALQPTRGIGLMQERRQKAAKLISATPKILPDTDLCNGPGKLVQAMGISKDVHNNQTYTTGDLYINACQLVNFNTLVTPRIGISVGVDLPYRYLIANNPFCSKK